MWHHSLFTGYIWRYLRIGGDKGFDEEGMRMLNDEWIKNICIWKGLLKNE